MAKLTPAAFAAWCWKHIELDTWLTEATLARRLAGVGNCPFTATGLLGALLRAGWLTPHPTYPDTYCLASVCWLSERPTSKTTEPCASAKI